MKKVLIVCCLLLLFYGRYEPVNLTTTRRRTKQIEVKDEVKHPGMYTADIHADTEEILKEVGGLKKGAGVSGINQTQDLSNRSVLVVGKQQEQKKIPINSATERELQTLTGIGPSTAQRITVYRSQQPFQTIEDIVKVRGIREKLFAKIEGQVTLRKIVGCCVDGTVCFCCGHTEFPSGFLWRWCWGYYGIIVAITAYTRCLFCFCSYYGGECCCFCGNRRRQ